MAKEIFPLKKLVTSVAVLCAVMGAVVTLSPRAAMAQAAAAQPTIGMVDVQKAFSEYSSTKASNDEITNLVKTFKAELDTRSSHLLLTDAELTELVKLNAKPQKVDADNKRIDELEKASKQRDEEVNTLSQKTDPTEQERARLRELRDLSNKNDASNRTLADDYNQQVEKRKGELSDKITADIKAAIAKVAQAKGLATVVDKIAVLYGGLDLTDEVIKALNGK